MSDELNGQTFENKAATPSDKSRIEDGEYVENAPDPTQARGLGGRRTSGGRLLPDLPSAEIDGNGSPDATGDESLSTQNKAPAKSTAAKRS